MLSPGAKVFRGTVITASSATGDITVMLGGFGTSNSVITISKVGRTAVSGLWKVPKIGDQVFVTGDDESLSNACIIPSLSYDTTSVVGGAIAATDGSFSGTVTAASFAGNGARLTNVNHSTLVNLTNDDHTQYYNQTRGDARYLTLTGGTLTGSLSGTGASFTGTVTAATFSGAHSGSGASLTSIPNGATTAVSTNTASAIVARDASGNFSAGTITAALSGNASTATTLQTARNINNVSFNGSADITVTAAAGTLTGATLASGVTASSLTSVGTLGSLSVTGTVTAGTFSGAHSGSGASLTSIPNSATTATSANTANTIVARDSGNATIIGRYYGTGAAGFGVDGGKGPVLRSDGDANWIHFNWDGSAFRCYVDSTLVKTFVIDHPDDDDKYLVHACAEGPTADVFYRGEAKLIEGIVRIDLPSYFESLTELEGRTVQITPIIEHGEAWKTANLAASRVENGSFWVFQTGGCNNDEQPFWWRVDAVRKNTTFAVEPNKQDVKVSGQGPYTYIS